MNRLKFKADKVSGISGTLLVEVDADRGMVKKLH